MGANELKKRLDYEFERYNDGLITEQDYFNKCFEIASEYIQPDDEIFFDVDKDS
jgi:hypothetical protein